MNKHETIPFKYTRFIGRWTQNGDCCTEKAEQVDQKQGFEKILSTMILENVLILDGSAMWERYINDKNNPRNSLVEVWWSHFIQSKSKSLWGNLTLILFCILLKNCQSYF